MKVGLSQRTEEKLVEKVSEIFTPKLNEIGNTDHSVWKEVGALALLYFGNKTIQKVRRNGKSGNST